MSWKKVCSVHGILENEMKEFDIDGVGVLLARNSEGFFGYPALCPHMESQLAFGTCDGKLITCMQHLWQWDIQSGDPVGLAEEPLKQYQTKIEDESVFIFIENELKYSYQED